MTGRRLPYALAIVLVLAGCAGGGGPPPGEVTVTPAPVPTDQAPTPAYRLAPGLAESGVVSPLALADAHADILRASVYRVRIEERTAQANGLSRRRVLHGTFANRTAYRFRVVQERGNETELVTAFYADGDALFERQVTAGETRYYRPRDTLYEAAPYPQDPLGSPHQREQVYVALEGTRPGFNETETAAGDTRYRLSAAAPSDETFLAAMAYVDRISEYEFRATVTAQGLVTSYRLWYVATVDGERRRVVRTARWTAVGNATVTAPEWYATARNRTGP